MTWRKIGNLRGPKGDQARAPGRTVVLGGGHGGGSSALTVKDEGSDLDTAVTSIDFTGSGVTASAVGHAVTVDIPGGGGSGITLVQSTTDPGAIGANNLWLRLDPTQSWAPMLYVRNTDDTGWADIDNAGYLLGLTAYNVGGDPTATVSISDTNLQVVTIDPATFHENGLIVTTAGPALLADNGTASLSLDVSGVITIVASSFVLNGNPFAPPAASVADIADPTTATAEDVANKVNELMASLRTAGLLAP